MDFWLRFYQSLDLRIQDELDVSSVLEWIDEFTFFRDGIFIVDEECTLQEQDMDTVRLILLARRVCYLIHPDKKIRKLGAFLTEYYNEQRSIS